MARPLPEPDDQARRGPNWLLIGAAVVVIALLALGGYTVRGLLLGSASPGLPGTSPTQTATSTPTATAGSSPSPRASPIPGPVPTFAPAAAGAVKKVTLIPPDGGCTPGSRCTFGVDISFTPTGSPHAVTWTFKTFDPCTYQVSDLPGGSIDAQGDWNLTQGHTSVSLPSAKGQLAVVALSGPDQAASAPLLLGKPAC